MGALEIRPLREGDAPEVLRSFNQVFAAGAIDRPPRSLAAWRWAYEGNPAGRRAFVALDAGRVVAHFAALPVRTLLAGRELVFAQGVDSFALPSHRGAAGGQAFVRTARAFFEAYGGSHDALYYGWPSERAWRVGKRALGYQAVRTQMALVQELSAASAGGGDGVEVLTSLDQQALWLFERCAGKLLALIRLRMGAELRSRLESRDILNATLLRGFERLDQFERDDGTALMGWLARIAENEIRDQRDYHRRQRRDVGREAALDDGAGALAARVRSQTSRLVLREDLDDANVRLVQLPYLAGAIIAERADQQRGQAEHGAPYGNGQRNHQRRGRRREIRQVEHRHQRGRDDAKQRHHSGAVASQEQAAQGDRQEEHVEDHHLVARHHEQHAREPDADDDQHDLQNVAFFRIVMVH